MKQHDHYDAREALDPTIRQEHFFTALPAQIARAQSTAYFSKTLAGINPQDINHPSALAQLPIVRKKDLLSLQKNTPPFGGLNATPAHALRRIYSSPGPIYDLEGAGKDWWRFARALYAAGFRRGDLIHNTFSYHFTPAGMMVETGAEALGCAVFPAGIGQTEMQVAAIHDLQPHAYVGTPSFLSIILDKAKSMNGSCASITKALVSGEAFLPAQKAHFEAHGINAYQAYATADLGLIAYESSARSGLIVDEGLWVEIVRVGGTEALPVGEVGEVVVTSMNPDYPLIRFGTGDLSMMLGGDSPCGRTHQRLKGWMGRADQTTKVKGMFVHPEQIEAVMKAHPTLMRARLVVTHDGASDQMTLLVETDAPIEEQAAMTAAIAHDLRDKTKLRGEVKVLPPRTLANDGKVIEDQRPIH